MASVSTTSNPVSCILPSENIRRSIKGKQRWVEDFKVALPVRGGSYKIKISRPCNTSRDSHKLNLALHELRLAEAEPCFA